MKTLQLVKIKFPEIQLHTRDAHKLRGYFGNLFKEHSEILTNHFESGENKYQYPLVQYKVFNRVPTLVGMGEGARLLIQLFLQIKELNINEQLYQLKSKNLESFEVMIGHSDSLHVYKFETLWMGLNQQNFFKYQKQSSEEKTKFLQKVLTGNILSFFKGVGLRLTAEQKIMTLLQVQEKQTKFKDTTMLAFQGTFTTNTLLPEDIGLGKSVSRGFGSIKKL